MESTDAGCDKRFTRFTPKTQGPSYLRILDPAHGTSGGAPISSRICQDVNKFLVALCAIRDALGICVPGLSTRAGHRSTAGAGIAQRRGKRVMWRQIVSGFILAPRARARSFLPAQRSATQSREVTRLYL